MAHQVKVLAAQSTLPNGITYPLNAIVTLTDKQFATIQPIEFTDGSLQDLGPIYSVGHIVTAEGTLEAGDVAIDLPNGVTLLGGQSIMLDDGTFASLSPTAIGEELIDGGVLSVDLLGNAPVTKTAAYTLVALDNLILVNAAGGVVVITLPAAPIVGRRYTVKKIDASANVVTVRSTTGNIDGTAAATGINLSAQYASQDFVWDATQWWLT